MTTTDAVLRCHRHPKYTGIRMYHRYKPGLPPGFDDPDCAGCDAVYAARHSGGWRETRTRKIKIDPFEYSFVCSSDAIKDIRPAGYLVGMTMPTDDENPT